jgi:hypothetical protein
MTTSKVILLVKNRFETTLGQHVHVASVHPEGRNGWAVFVEVAGVVWRQRVSGEGVLGTCTAISTSEDSEFVGNQPNVARLPGFN